MLTKIGFALVTLALLAASYAYSGPLTEAMAPISMSKQIACNHYNCIGAIPHCRDAVISGWNDSLYAAAKAPGIELRSCSDRSDLAMGD